jgi:C4-dicarboxylate transporter
VLPVFSTLPHIFLGQAVGLMMFVGLFKYVNHEESTLSGVKIEKKPMWVLAILYPWLVLGIAYFIKQFI